MSSSMVWVWLIVITIFFQVSSPAAQGGVGGGGNNNNSNSNSNPFNTIIILYVVSAVVSLLILLGIGFFAFKFVKKVKPGVLRELRNRSAHEPNPDPVWQQVDFDVDAPTIEKFLREIADDKPVRFTAQQLYTFTDNYSTRLGSGGFGDVYKGQFPNGVNVAVKVLKRGGSDDKKVEDQFMAEIKTISNTYHMNLVKLYGFCYDKFISALVFEFMENGSLDKFLYDKSKEIEWEKLNEIAIGTAKGIAYLHEECQRRIIHYDIKPGNILLDSNFLPKVADFGLANLCNRDNTHESVTGFRGTPGYSAPEFLTLNFPITFKCDVYSFGMVLFEIVGRRRNATIDSSGSIDWFPKRVWDRFQIGDLKDIAVACHIEKKDWEKVSRMCTVALCCVQDSPEKRPPMSIVVKMLEGGVDIKPPSMPFRYMYPSSNETTLTESQQASSELSYSTSQSKSHVIRFKESSPIVHAAFTV